MKAHFTIIHERAVTEACEVINNLDFATPHTVEIKPKKRDRSAAQNRLYWQWLGIISNETGHTNDELHLTYKREYLVPIFRRTVPSYKSMIKTVQKLQGEKGYASVVKEIIRLTSTTDCDTKQFTEYLNEIEKAACDIGCTLPHPEDLYYEAMGVKER